MAPIPLDQICSPVAQLFAPGNMTGVYYVIVCGLPWNFSWQDLKDFSRNHIDNSTTHKDIDRVEVFGTNGWVRVKGKESFLKIFDHLNGGQLEGRSLIADGRNETMWTIILTSSGAEPQPKQRSDSISTFRGDMVGESSPTSGYSQDGGARSSVYSGHESSVNSNYPQSPSSNLSSLPSPIFASSPCLQQSPIFEHYATQPQYIHYGGVYVNNFTPVTPLYAAPPILIPTRVPTYMAPPPTPEMMRCPVPVPYQQPAPTPTPVVRTEARKIVITKLAHSVDEATLEALLRGVTLSHSPPGSECHVKAEIAYHTSGERKGERKDHAFSVFQTAALARRAIRALNGYEFHGRRITVKLAKEGERPLRTNPPTPPPPLYPHVSSRRPPKIEENVMVNQSRCNEIQVGSENALNIGIELSSRTPAVVDGSSGAAKRGCRNRSNL